MPQDGGFSVCVRRDDLLGLSVACRRSHAGKRAEVCRTEAADRLLPLSITAQKGTAIPPSCGGMLSC